MFHLFRLKFALKGHLIGEKETPTHSGRCIFYTLGIKMEPTRPTDSLVNHFYTTHVENASPTHVGGSFLKSHILQYLRESVHVECNVIISNTAYSNANVSAVKIF